MTRPRTVLRPLSALALGVLLGGALPAAAQVSCEALGEGPYWFINRNTNDYATPEDGSTAEDARIIQVSLDEEDEAQRWTLEDAGGGFTRFRNVASGLHLWVQAEPTDENVQVVQRSLVEGAPEQEWAIEAAEDGFCRVRHRQSGLYLRGRGNRDTEGTPVVVLPLNENANSQQWSFVDPDGGRLPEPPDGPRLRALASQLGVPVGGGVNPFALGDAVYEAVLPREFDTTVCTTRMKPGQVSLVEGEWEWELADDCRDFAVENGLRYHGHALVMIGAGNPANIPAWWEDLTPAAFEAAFDFHVDTVATRYADAVDVWHVVNEAVTPGGGFREWQGTEVFGYREGVPNYIVRAFEHARAADPTATLLYTEGFSVQNDPAMLATILDMLTKLKAWDVPIDGVGLQMHTVSTDNDHDLWIDFAGDVAALGYEFHITEHDVSIRSEEFTEATAAEQAQVYREVLDAFLALPNRGDYVLWGYTDRHSWRHPDRNGAFLSPLPFDTEYQPKPAYYAMQGAFLRAVPTEPGPGGAPGPLRIERVYPNPSADDVRLMVSSSVPGPFGLGVYDALGREVVRATLASVREPVDLPLAGLPAGVYTVRVWTGGASATARLTLVSR